MNATEASGPPRAQFGSRLGILATMAMPALKNVPRKAAESVLKSDLRTFRDVIDQFHADKGHYPSSLQVLAEEGYIRGIPVDPITKSAETWIEVYEEVDYDEYAAETDMAEDGAPGVWDVHSGSEELALNGESYYSEW